MKTLSINLVITFLWIILSCLNLKLKSNVVFFSLSQCILARPQLPSQGKWRTPPKWQNGFVFNIQKVVVFWMTVWWVLFASARYTYFTARKKLNTGCGIVNTNIEGHLVFKMCGLFVFTVLLHVCEGKWILQSVVVFRLLYVLCIWEGMLDCHFTLVSLICSAVSSSVVLAVSLHPM